MRKIALAPPPSRKPAAPKAANHTLRRTAKDTVQEHPDTEEGELELDYRSFEEQCKARPLPPGTVPPRAPIRSFGELYHWTLPIVTDDLEEA